MTYLDHVAAVIVSLFLLKAAWEITAPSFAQLVDAGVSEKERQHISELALSVEKTRGLHALRTRYIGSGILVDCHLFVDPDMTVLESHQIAHEVKRRLLQENANIVDALIHVEPWKRKAPDSTAPEGKDSTS
jgi:cation diffusion facilitator family transporter